MFNLLLGFAAGWWVANRQATGQPIIPAAVQQVGQKLIQLDSQPTPGTVTASSQAAVPVTSGSSTPKVVSASRLLRGRMATDPVAADDGLHINGYRWR